MKLWDSSESLYVIVMILIIDRGYGTPRTALRYDSFPARRVSQLIEQQKFKNENSYLKHRALIS